MSTVFSDPSEPFDIFDYGVSHQFGDLHFFMDKASGMRAIIAIHSTKLGPALGGCRYISYPHTNTAILDVMRLARGMSYKAALANLPLGGGKGVILKPAEPHDRKLYLKAFAEFVHALQGRYITAEDSGTNVDDMDYISKFTPYVTGLSHLKGDPSPFTAKGVLCGIEAMVKRVLGKSSLRGVHVGIQGLGNVGFRLARLLHESGAVLTVADVNPTQTDLAKKMMNARVASTEELTALACDVLSPCALGGIVNDATIEQIQAPIIAGAANNQLAHTHHGQRLLEKNIAYAVDYVINAGGLLSAASQYLRTEEHLVEQQLARIGETLVNIYDQSLTSHQSTNRVADKLAEEKLS